MGFRTATTGERLSLPLHLAVTLTIAAGSYVDRAAYGHADFMSFIQHRVSAKVGSANIDITVELTFFEIPSLAERERMDTNHDKALTDDEVKAYLGRIAESLNKSMSLSVGGRSVDLTPLYDPEIDMLGVKKVVPYHHVLLLYYFARTPAWLTPGTEIAIAGNLWPTAKALCSFEVVGNDGYAFAADSISSTSAAAGPWTVCARCSAAPGNAMSVEGKDGLSRTSLVGLAATALVVVAATGVFRRRRKIQEVTHNAGIHGTEV